MWYPSVLHITLYNLSEPRMINQPVIKFFRAACKRRRRKNEKYGRGHQRQKNTYYAKSDKYPTS